MRTVKKEKIFGLGIVTVLLLSGFVVFATPASGVVSAEHKTFVAMFLQNKNIPLEETEILADYGQMKVVSITEKEKTILEASGALLVDIAYMKNIGLDTGTFDPLATESDVPLVGKYFLVQFAGMPSADDIAKLTDAGAKILMYFPYNTYLVYGNVDAMKEISGKNGIRYVGNYGKEYKVHPALVNKIGKFGITIQIYADENLKYTLKTIGDYAERIYMNYPKGDFYIVKAEISHMALRKIVDLEDVLWIEPFSFPTLLDEVAVEIHSGPYSGAGGYIQSMGWQGDGVIVGLADTGLDDGNYSTMHPDLQGRVVGLIDYTETNTSDGIAEDRYGHGTHCAGIIAGNAATGMTDENGYLYGYGMAPKAKVVMQRIFDDDGWWAYNYPVSVMTSEAANNSVKIHSNSWGASVAGDYDDLSQDFDWAVRDANPYNSQKDMITYIFAAGNEGPGTQTVGSPGTAKNVITVAASENYRPNLGSYGDNPEEIAAFSSRGPAADGRWKPEIAGVGTWVASALSSSASPGWGWGNINEYYEWCGGTSMATPHVAGGAVLFFEYYSKIYGKEPTPALVKAALINGADDMRGGEYGGSAPIPNEDEGWGRMNLTKVIQPDFGVAYVDGGFNLKTGDVFEKDVQVLDGSKPLKVTMSYLDMPAAISANPTLVNDLNLIVIAPDNTIYYGNAFANGWSAPTGTPDARNNLENVFIKQPVPGTYRIIVYALNVVQDAVNETAAIDQDFSLVISGNIPTEHPGIIRMDREAYKPDGKVTITVSDADLNTNSSTPESVSVKIESGLEPYGETVVLTETGANTGVFNGSIQLKTGNPSPGNGYLEVNVSDTIKARYLDLAPLGERTATAAVDGISPVISGVHVFSVRATKATIKWNTDEPATSVIYYWEENNPVPLKVTGEQIFSSKVSPGIAPGFVLEKREEINVLGIPVNVKTTNVVSQSGYVTDHVITLENLKPLTTYYFYVESVDVAGNSATDNNSGANYTFTTLPPPEILLVDDDMGSTYEQYFTTALDAANYSYDVWDVYSAGSPSLADLKRYDVVIWTTGADYSQTLTSQDEQNLAAFLDGGGRLFLSAQDYLWDVGLTTFGQNYLHIGSYTNDVGVTRITGVTGDPISDGLTNIWLRYPFTNYGDRVNPDAYASTVFTDQNGRSCAIRYEDPTAGFRTVFFGFPFESITYNNLTNGTIVIDRVLKWLNPPQPHDLAALSISTNKSWSLPGESVNITATIFNKGTQDETNIEVKFYADGSQIDVKYIPSLQSKKLATLSTAYAFPVEGAREISVEVTPVPGETRITNNIISGKAYVRTPVGPIKIGVVDSLGTDASSYMVWETLNNTWYKYSNYMFEFDTNSLNKEGLTLADFKASGADVLFISDAWNAGYGWEFTDSEIQAIKTYIMMAHGIIATSGTFNTNVPNNMKLADAFGLDPNTPGVWAETLTSPFTILNTTHPIFNEISAPYMPGYPYACANLNITSATLLANATTSSGGYSNITEYKYAAAEAIYFGHIPEYAGYANAQDIQLVANAIIWAYENSTPLAHDLFPTSIELPDYTPPNQQIYINTTVYNAGTNTETNVAVDLVVNSVVNQTKTISSIAPKHEAPVSFAYTPPSEGTYTIEIYVHPVAGETVDWNNRISGELYVFTPKGPIKVAMVDSWGLDAYQYTVFSEIEQNWYKLGEYMIEFDLTLNKENISLNDLISTGAHVVFISNACDDGTWTGYNWEFTDAEIQALKDYIYNGHGAVATAWTFGDGATNNMKLAPAFGIAQTPYGYWDELDAPPGYTLLVPTHPVFNRISNPYLSGEDSGYMQVCAGLAMGGGTKLANGTTYYNDEAIIVNNTYGFGATVYTSGIPEYAGLACAADKQFLYNAIVYAYRNTTYIPTLLHTPVISAPANTPIPVSVVAKEVDDGVKNVTLYYANVGSWTYTPINMVRTSGDAYNGVWNATIPAQTSTGEVHYYFVAYDNSGHQAKLPFNAPTENYTIVIDGTPPVITHTPPASIEVNTGTAITAQVTDNGEVSAVYINYTDVNSVNRNESMLWMGGNTYTYFLPLQPKPGNLFYVISAVDKCGNWNFTIQYSVPVVDTQDPIIQHIPILREDAMVPFDIICKVTDNYAVESVKLRYTTPDNQNFNVSMTQFAPDYYKYTVPGQPIGTFKYSIYAIDKAGNDAATIQYTVPIVDTVPPIIRLLYPTPVVNTNTITVFAYCDDSQGYSGLGVAYVYLDYLNFSGLVRYDGDYINCTIPFTLRDGEHFLHIDMFDKAGNYASFETIFTVDTIGPSLKVTNPENGIVIPTNIVNVTGTTDPGATVLVNGVPATVLADGKFFCEITLNEGANTILVSANDSAGNTNNIELNVIVDTIVPVLIISNPQNGAVLNTGEVLVTGKVTEANLDKLEVNGIMVDVAADGSFAMRLYLPEGTNTIAVKATDKAGHVTTETLTVTVDSIPPALTISSPQDGTYISTTSVNVTGSTEPGATVVVNGYNATVFSDGSFYCEFAVSDGALTIKVLSSDAAGNKNTKEIKVIVDATPPVITLTNPAPNSVYNKSTVIVSGTLTEANLKSLTVNGYGVIVGAGGAFTYNLVLADGSGTVTVVAEDLAGNTATVTRTVVVDTTIPVITVSSPMDASIIANKSVIVAGTTEPGATLKINGNNIQVASNGAFNTLLTLNEGTNEITFYAEDVAHNTYTTKLKVVVDSLAPEITINAPENNTTINSTTVTINGKVVDANLRSIKVNGASAFYTSDGNFTYTFTYTLTLSEGTNTIDVVADDWAGHTTTSEITVEIDTTPPVLVVMLPATTSSTTCTLNGTTEPGAEVYVNGVKVTVDANGTFATTLNLKDGTNIVTVKAIDSAGNVNAQTYGVLCTKTISDEFDNLNKTIDTQKDNIDKLKDDLNNLNTMMLLAVLGLLAG
ncbi:MAG: S8 family serine peptidase, partial [Thermoplasmata archaeon]